MKVILKVMRSPNNHNDKEPFDYVTFDGVRSIRQIKGSDYLIIDMEGKTNTCNLVIGIEVFL